MCPFCGTLRETSLQVQRKQYKQQSGVKAIIKKRDVVSPLHTDKNTFVNQSMIITQPLAGWCTR